MSDHPSNPLDGLPSPQKGAKPSPLNSEPGHDHQGERWWLKDSISPDAPAPETVASVDETDTVKSEPHPQESREETARMSESEPEPELARTQPEIMDVDETQVIEASSKTPLIVLALVAVVFLVGFLFMHGGT